MPKSFLMGEVQIDILKQLMKDRFNEDITVDEGDVAYLETIKEPIEGVGHFEPPRHYSEVHLYLEPLPQGSGLIFDNQCQNNLEERYQNLIMTLTGKRTLRCAHRFSYYRYENHTSRW